MHVAHFLQGLGTQCGPTGRLAVTDDVHVAALERRIIGKLELQKTTGNVYRARYVTSPVLIRITHIQQKIGILDGIVRLIQGHFLNVFPGGFYEVMGSFPG